MLSVNLFCVWFGRQYPLRNAVLTRDDGKVAREGYHIIIPFDFVSETAYLQSG